MKKYIILCLALVVGQAYAQQTVNTQIINNATNTKTMENEPKKVVAEFLTAVQHGDNAKLAAILHPGVEWSQPGSNRLSGIKKSNTEVFQMVGKMFELSDRTLRLTDFKAISVNGNRVACLLHWNAAQPTGSVLDVDNIDVYTVENGQITKAEIFSADIAKEDQFWGGE
ncbi:MAG: nuclear transport factor 2 family protein [Mucilaginibacter sp.]